jgi:hypothetical protein
MQGSILRYNPRTNRYENVPVGKPASEKAGRTKRDELLRRRKKLTDAVQAGQPLGRRNLSGPSYTAVLKDIDSQIAEENAKARDVRSKFIEPLKKKLDEGSFDVVGRETLNNLTYAYRNGYIKPSEYDQLSAKYKDVVSKVPTTKVEDIGTGQMVPASKLMMGGQYRGAEESVEDVEAASAEEKAGLAGGIAKLKNAPDQTGKILTEGTLSGFIGVGSGLGSSLRPRETRGVGSSEEDEYSPLASAYEAEQRRVADVEQKRLRGEFKPWEDISSQLEPDFNLALGAGAEQGAQQFTMGAPQIGNRMFGVKDKDYEEAYMRKFGDVNDKTYQVGRFYGERMAMQAVSLAATIPVMQLYGQAAVKLATPFATQVGTLNVARTAGMLTPTALGVGSTLVGPETTAGKALAIAGDPINSYLESLQPEEEKAARSAIQANDPSLAWGELGVSMAMFSGQTGRVYKDARQLYKMVKEANKSIKTTGVNPLRDLGSKTAAEYMQLSNEVVPDLTFGVTNLLHPVAQAISSKYNDKVEAPKNEDYVRSLIMAFGAMRPAGKLSGLFRSEIGGKDIYAGSNAKSYSVLEAKNIVENGDTFIQMANERFKSNFGGQDANVGDLKRIVSQLRKMAGQQFAADRQTPGTAWNSPSAIFAEMMSGRNVQQEAVDTLLQLARTKGDNQPVGPDNPLLTLQNNESLYPTTAVGKKNQINALAKEIEPQMRISLGADIPPTEKVVEPIDASKIGGKDFYAVKLPAEEGGKQEYLVYNKTFTDVVRTELADFADVQIIDAKDVTRLRGTGRTEQLTKFAVDEMNVEPNALSYRSPLGISIVTGVTNRGGVVVRTRTANGDVIRTLSYKEFVADNPRGDTDIKQTVKQSVEQLGLGTETEVADRSFPKSGDRDAFPTDINLGKNAVTGEEQTTVGRLLSIEGMVNPTGIYQLPDGSIIMQGIPRGGDQTTYKPLTEQELLSGDYASKLSMVEQVSNVVSGDVNYIDMPLQHLGTVSRVVLNAEQINRLGDIARSEMSDESKELAIAQVVSDYLADTTAESGFVGRVANGDLIYDTKARVGDVVLARIGDNINPEKEAIVIDSKDGMVTVKALDNPEGMSYTLSANDVVLDSARDDYKLGERAAGFTPSEGTPQLRPLKRTLTDEENAAAYTRWRDTQKAWEKIKAATPDTINDVLLDVLLNGTAPVAQIQEALISFSLEHGIIDTMGALYNALDSVTRPNSDVDYGAISRIARMFSGDGFEVTLNQVHQHLDSLGVMSEAFASANAKIPSSYSRTARPRVFQVAHQINLLLGRPSQSKTDAALFRSAVKALRLTEDEVNDLSLAKVTALSKLMRSVAGQAFYHMSTQWHIDSIAGLRVEAQVSLGRAIYAARDEAIRQSIKDSNLPDSLADFWKNEASYNKAKRDAKDYVLAFGDKALEELHALGLEFFYYQANTVDQRATIRLNSLNPEASIDFARKAAGYIANGLQLNILRTETNAKLRDGRFMAFQEDGTPDGTNTLAFLNMISSSDNNRQMVINTINNSDVDPVTKKRYVESLQDLLKQVDELNPAQKTNYEAVTDATGKTTPITETNGEAKSIEKELDDHVTTRSMQLLADAMGVDARELSKGLRRKNIEAIHTAIRQIRQEFIGQQEAFLSYVSKRPDMIEAKLEYARAKDNEDTDAERIAGAKISDIRKEAFDEFASSRIGLVKTVRNLINALDTVSEDADGYVTPIGKLPLVNKFRTAIELAVNDALQSYNDAVGFYTPSGNLKTVEVRGKQTRSVNTSILGVLGDNEQNVLDNIDTSTFDYGAAEADTKEYVDNILPQRIREAEASGKLDEAAKLRKLQALFEAGFFTEGVIDRDKEEASFVSQFNTDINNVFKLLSDFDMPGMLESVFMTDKGIYDYLQNELSAGITELYKTNAVFKQQWKTIPVQAATQAAVAESSAQARRARVAEAAEFLTTPIKVDESGRITLQGLRADAAELRPEVATTLGEIEAENAESPVRVIDVTEQDAEQLKPVDVEQDLLDFVSDAPLIIQDAFEMEQSEKMHSADNNAPGKASVQTFVGHNRAGVQSIFEGILRNSFSGRGQEFIEILGDSNVDSQGSVIKSSVNGLEVLNVLKMSNDPSQITLTDAVKGIIVNNWVSKTARLLPSERSMSDRISASRKFINDAMRRDGINTVADLIEHMKAFGSEIGLKPTDVLKVLVPRAGTSDIDFTKVSDNHAYRIGIGHAILSDGTRSDAIQFKNVVNNEPHRPLTSGSVDSRYGGSSLFIVPVDMSKVDVRVAKFMADSYDKIDKSGMRQEDIKVLERITEMYNERARGSVVGDTEVAIRLDRDVQAARQLAAGLADMYDMFAYGHATRAINREMTKASEGVIKGYADIVRRITGSDVIADEFMNVARRMSLSEAFTRMKADGTLTDKQVRYAMVYATARHKKDYYQNIAQTHFTDWAWLATSGTKIADVVGGEKLYGFMTKIRRDEAVMNLVAIGKGSSNGYRSAFTLAHEIGHVLIDSLDPQLQAKFMETLFPDNMEGTIIEPLNKASFTSDDNPYAVMRAQLIAVRKAVESGKFTTLQDAWKTDPRLVNYSERWHTAGHEMGVTGLLNMALRNDFVISDNDAASIDYDMMSVLEQVSGPLNAFARQIMKSNPTDLVMINGAPRAVWVGKLPVVSYTTTNRPSSSKKKGFVKREITRPFISMRRNDFVRFSVTPQLNRQVGGMFFGPETLVGGMNDPAFRSTSKPAHMGYGYEVEYDSRETYLPVSDGQAAAILADRNTESFVAPRGSMANKTYDPATGAQTNTFNGQVVGMIVKTKFTNIDDVRAAGFEPALRTQDPVDKTKSYWWVKSAVEGDSWFTPRAYQTAGSEAMNQRGARYQTAVTDDYAYVVESPVTVWYKDSTPDGPKWRTKTTNSKFILGQTALLNDSMQAKMMGNTGGYDAKFSNLIYNMNRKFNLAQYQMRGDLRFRDQQVLENELGLGVSKKFERNYSFDPQLDLQTRLGSYMGSEQQRVVAASGIDYGARISAGSRVFKNTMWNIMKQSEDYFSDIGYLTEAGESFIGSVNDALIDVTDFIKKASLYRHNDKALNSVRGMSTDAPVVLVGRNSPEARAMQAFYDTVVQTAPDGSSDAEARLYAKRVYRRIYDVMNNFDATGVNKGMSLESIADMLESDPMTTDASSYFEIDVDGQPVNVLPILNTMFSSGLLHISETSAGEFGNERVVSQDQEFEDTFNDTVLSLNRGFDITSNNRLDQGAASVAAGHVMNLLFKHVYSKPSQQKDFLQRLQSEDINVRARALSEVQSVALLSDLQSREIGRALYNWQEFKIIGDSFAQKNNVIIEHESGATFRVSLTDNSVSSVHKDPFTGTWIDGDHLNDRVSLYKTEASDAPRKKAKGDVVEDITQDQIINILSETERNELATRKSIIIARPMSIEDLINNNAEADTTSGLRLYKVDAVRKTQSLGGIQATEKIGISSETGMSFTATELANPYKSVYEDGSNNQDIASQNPRLLIDTVFKNNILNDKQREAVGNKKIVPMQVHVAKLLTSQELLRGLKEGTSLESWMENSKKLTTVREAFFEAENGSVYKEVSSAVVKSDEGSTWMSSGYDMADVEDIMPDQYKHAMDPGFEIPEKFADDPGVVQAYRELQATRFIKEATTVPAEPKNLVIHNDDTINGVHSSSQVKGDTLYISIPTRVFEETASALFSTSSSPTPGGPTTTPSVVKLAPGQMSKMPWYKTKKGRAVSSVLSGIWVELTSIAKAAVLNYDFGRTFIQNYALTSMNPKNAMMQFYGLTAILPNLPFGSSPTTGKGGFGKLVGAISGHRKLGAYGDKMYHRIVQGLFSKYGTPGNEIRLGILPFGPKTEVFGLGNPGSGRAYTIDDLTKAGLVTDYGQWFAEATKLALMNGTDVYDYAIQNTTSESLGSGVLAKLLPAANAIERGNSLSTDILRIKSWLEYAAQVDSNILLSQYQKMKMKQDHATHINAISGAPAGSDPALKPVVKNILDFGRTVMSAPQWHKSQAMQTLLPAFISMGLKATANNVIMGFNKHADPLGIGDGWVDNYAERRFFSRGKESWIQTARVFANMVMQTAILGMVSNILSQYIDNKRFLAQNKTPTDWNDFATIFGYNHKKFQGVAVGPKLFDNLNPMKEGFGKLRLFNSVLYDLPQSATFFNRTLVEPFQRASKATSTDEALRTYFESVAQTTFFSKLTSLAGYAKTAATGKTFTGAPALQQSKGYDVMREGRIKIPFSPMTIMDPVYRAALGENASELSLSLTNVQYQSFMNDIAIYDAITKGTGDNELSDTLKWSMYLRLFGVNSRFNNYALKDQIDELRLNGLFYDLKEASQYPNAPEIASKYGMRGVVSGIPDSAPQDQARMMYQLPSEKTKSLSKLDKKKFAEAVTKSPDLKIPLKPILPSDEKQGPSIMEQALQEEEERMQRKNLERGRNRYDY